ncbi:MAG: hypothetical protein GY899_17590 [Verrucomicrobiaceae bacterium]|nr:hypothetical protein [Verrucomicrobiaceae bacterium]
MCPPLRSAEQSADDSLSEALESLGQSISRGQKKADFPGSGAFDDPDVMAALADLPSSGAMSKSKASLSGSDSAHSEEIRPYLEEETEIPMVTRKRNRRGRRSFWPPLIILGMVQVAVMVALGLIMLPVLKEKSLTLEAVSSSLIKFQDETRVLQKRLEVGEQRIDSLLTEVVQMKRSLELNPEDARAELDYLGVRNRFVQMADSAIQKADRLAFDQLLKVADEEEDEKLRNGAMSEVYRVRFAYLNGLRSSGHALPVGELFPSLRGKDEMALGTDQLINVLQDQGVEAGHRARAAYLLADHRHINAVNALVDAVSTDANLDVVREASLTFGEMTGYRGEELLDASGLVEWWRENSKVVKLALGN